MNFPQEILENAVENEAHALFYDDFKRQKIDNYELVEGNYVHQTAIVNWNNLIIGKNNIIGPYACIGLAAQHTSKKSCGHIKIGDSNIFREYATVHMPTEHKTGTVIGNKNYFMVNSHVAHDCLIENNVIMCNNSAIAGHVHLMQGCVLALNSSVHQFQRIGSWSMIGMNSCVVKKSSIEPGYTFFGVPVKKVGKNRVAISRNRISDEMLSRETDRFMSLGRTK